MSTIVGDYHRFSFHSIGTKLKSPPIFERNCGKKDFAANTQRWRRSTIATVMRPKPTQHSLQSCEIDCKTKIAKRKMVCVRYSVSKELKAQNNPISNVIVIVKCAGFLCRSVASWTFLRLFAQRINWFLSCAQHYFNECKKEMLESQEKHTKRPLKKYGYTIAHDSIWSILLVVYFFTQNHLMTMEKMEGNINQRSHRYVGVRMFIVDKPTAKHRTKKMEAFKQDPKGDKRITLYKLYLDFVVVCLSLSAHWVTFSFVCTQSQINHIYLVFHSICDRWNTRLALKK